MEMQYCDQCDNHCPANALKCGRGRRHFGLENVNNGQHMAQHHGKHGHSLPDGPLGLLMQCGHVLHHGGTTGENLLSALTLQEQAELERMLKVLLADWENRKPGN